MSLTKTQLRFNKTKILDIMDQLDLVWITPFLRQDEWNTNMDLVSRALIDWCKEHGVQHFYFGHTQIELTVTFAYQRDAVLFKLRWV